MRTDVFYGILWILILGGLVPSLWFVYSWRPAARWSARQLDAGGWVGIIAGLYVLAALRAILGHYREPANLVDGLGTFAIGALIDAILWLRVLRWESFRRDAPEHPLRRVDDPPEVGEVVLVEGDPDPDPSTG